MYEPHTTGVLPTTTLPGSMKAGIKFAYPSPAAPVDGGQVTQLLQAMSAGDEAALEKLAPLIYEELRAIARGYLRREKQDHTLQPTALVNEVYIKLLQQHESHWLNRGHFYCIAARMMRRILVDSSRHRRRVKRGSGEIAFDIADMEIAAPASSAALIDILALHEALERLSEIDERMVQIVELRFFAGFGNEEIARLLGISEPTVKRSWATARAWLFRYMQAS